MSASSHAEMGKHIRAYIGVFVALLFLTLVTVGISYLHFSPAMAVLVALFVATIKGALVGAVFMHLNDERKIIYWLLGLTFVLFVPLVCITLML